MSQFKRTFCVYHPEEYITNFCKDRNCLMPLCPTCIGSHNDYHDKNGFKANYINIFDALAEAQTQIYNTLINLQQDKKRNEEVIYLIHNIPSVVKQKIQAAKNLTYSTLQKAFEQLEKQIITTFQQRHQEAGIYSLTKSEKFQKQLIQGIQDLYQMIQNLKTEKCLSSLIRYQNDVHAEFTMLHSSIATSLYANQSYTPFIDLNQEAINGIGTIVNRFLNLEFNFPLQVEKYPKEFNQTIVSRTLPNNNKILNNSIRKSSQKITPPKIRPQPATLTSFTQYVPTQRMTPMKSQLPVKSEIIINPPNTVNQTPVRKSNVSVPNNYEIEFQNLSKKVRQMRKQNELLSKALKNF